MIVFTTVTNRMVTVIYILLLPKLHQAILFLMPHICAFMDSAHCLLSYVSIAVIWLADFHAAGLYIFGKFNFVEENFYVWDCWIYR